MNNDIDTTQKRHAKQPNQNDAQRRGKTVLGFQSKRRKQNVKWQKE